jgi:hypothetical protein
MFLIVRNLVDSPQKGQLKFNLDRNDLELAYLRPVFNLVNQTHYNPETKQWDKMEIADENDPELKGSGLYDRLVKG